MAEFWQKTKDFLSAPFRKSAELGERLANSDYLPFHEAEELLAIPEAKKTEAQKERLKTLTPQIEDAAKGVSGMAKIAGRRAEERLVEPVVKPVKTLIAWVEHNWKYLAAAGVGATSLFAGGTVATIVCSGAAVFAANEYSMQSTGKNLFDNIRSKFANNEGEKPVSPTADKSPAISKSASPQESAPTSYVGGKPSWRQTIDAKKEVKLSATHVTQPQAPTH